MGKILIISHNPIGDEDNVGRTLKNLFEKIDKKDLCQIYIKNQKPQFSVCDNLYYINEKLVLKSNFNKSIDTGYKVTDYQSSVTKTSENKIKNAIAYKLRHRNQLNYFFRNFFWNHGNWFTKDLKDWLKTQNPSCLFFVISNYSFMFNIVNQISDFLNIPIFTYCLDEYYYGKEKQIIPFENNQYRKIFRQTLNDVKVNFCLSEKMVKLYSSLFTCKQELLMNSVKLNDIKYVRKAKKEYKMFYMGNLSYGRWQNLKELDKVITLCNQNNDSKIIFEVYSAEKSNKLISDLTSENKNLFKGKLSFDEVEEKIKEADFLVHVESFDPKNIKMVEYSLSTKIPDLLNSGKNIVVYGPIEDEAINYLYRNDAAVVIKSKNELMEKINDLYGNNDYEEICKNGIKLLINNHSQDNNCLKIKSVLEEYCEHSRN